ncbi:MAG TPA: tetratricopeptide repeat protein [Miltoncostaeaceae bacterium]|nr:tetratricopeptide repeat protein [Miltoncostaeaceae bacterium]
MKEAGVDRPLGAADRSGAPGGGQARTAAARTPQIIGVAALAGWAALAAAGGGIDPGDGLGGDGPTGAFLALAIGAPLAAVAVVLAWDRAALRSGPARLALAAMAGIALWSGLSIAWAAGPDLAWIDANREAVALCALVLGVSLGALVPRAPLAFGLGLSVAALVPVVWALGTKVVPGLLGADRDLGRLAAPVGYWNALALIAAFALPGLLWLAGDRRPWALPLAAAGIALYGAALVLTYSRGGVLAAAMAVGVTLALAPGRGRAVAALVAGAAGAAWPAAYGLRDTLLSSDGIPVALREDAGAGLGWRLAVGVAVAAALAPAIVWVWNRLGLGAGSRPRWVALGALIVLVLAVAGAAASPQGRDWADNRISELRGEGGDAVANTPGRLVSASGNQRKAWWGEAWRAFEDAPAIGQGAGGFSLVHLQERRNGDDALDTREAHGVAVGFLSGTGLVGTLLLAALVGGVVWGVLRATRVGAPPEIGLPLAVAAAFALQASIDWSWSIPALTVPALGAAGIVLAAAAPGPAPGAARRPGGLAAGALAAVATLAVASAVLPWWSARAASEGEDALARGDARTALERADDARATNPLALEPLLLRGEAYTDLGQPARALGAYRRAVELQPDNPDAWRALAIFLGDGRASAAAWAQVLRLDPQDPEAALRAGPAGR